MKNIGINSDQILKFRLEKNKPIKQIDLFSIKSKAVSLIPGLNTERKWKAKTRDHHGN